METIIIALSVNTIFFLALGYNEISKALFGNQKNICRY